MDEDIADMDAILARLSANNPAMLKADQKLAEQSMHNVVARQELDKNPPPSGFHEPPASFHRGQPLAIVAHAPKAGGVRLRYRRVNQAELWQEVQMEQTGKDFHTEIPATYTDSPFPLQYHFQIRMSDSASRTPRSELCSLYPGLKPGWHGQPYFVVRQAA